MHAFDHERSDVYSLARQLVRGGGAVLDRVQAARADLADQYRRTTLYLVLNIAQAGEENAAEEKLRYYRLARRSAIECAVLLDHMEDLALLTSAPAEPLKLVASRVAAALLKTMHGLDGGKAVRSRNGNGSRLLRG